MKVRLFGFEWTQAAISIDEFFAYLRTMSGEERQYCFNGRILFTDEIPGYFVGLLLTAKSQKKYCELSTGAKSLKVLVRQLRDNNRFVDFNFFIVNKLTGRGLYQHYFQSCSMPTFHAYLKKLYNELRDEQKTAALTKLDATTGSKKEERAIKSKYHKSMDMTPLYKKAEFESLLKDLKSITRIQYELGSLEFLEPWFGPSSGRLKKRRESVSFTAGSKNPLINGIMAMVHDKRSDGPTDQPLISNLSVTGVDPISEDDVTYKLSNNIESFAEFEFAEVTNEDTLNIQKITDSPLIAEMLNVVNDKANAVFFKTRAK